MISGTDFTFTDAQLSTARYRANDLVHHASAAYWTESGRRKYLAGLMLADLRGIAAALGYTVSRADDPEPAQ